MKTSAMKFLLNKNTGLRPVTLLKKTLGMCFSADFAKLFKNPFFTEHLWMTTS